MKTKTLLLSILVASLLLSTTVMAYPKGLGILKLFETKHYTNFRTILVEKDTSWSVVDDGAWGMLQGKFGKYLTFRASGLEPNTDYTLIYYGDETHNDVWPYATCIREMTTSSNGRIGLTTTKYDYSSFIDDGVDQKFWLILSSDINCNAKEMTAWNPSKYLFEWDII